MKMKRRVRVRVRVDVVLLFERHCILVWNTGL